MKIKSNLKITVIICYKLLFQLLYFMISILKKYDNNKVVFIVSRERKLQGNLQFIYNELKLHHPEMKIDIIFTENKMNLKLFKEIIIIGNAHYLILDDYYLPVYLMSPKKELRIIQLWHAAGAFKKFGYSTIGTRFGPDNSYLNLVPIHSNYTHVYVSSSKVVSYYAEAFNMSEKKIYPIGIPRLDLFNDTVLKEQIIQGIYKLHTDLEDNSCINILLAPTYRAKGNQKESNFNIIDSINHMIKYISKDIKIIFKPHPYMDKKVLQSLNKYANIIVAYEFSINDWMLVSDAFITDYSSSVFDFSILQKPIAHYVPDIDEYTKNRGFYKAIEEVSDGHILKNESELIKWINNRRKKEFFDTSRMVEFNFDNTKGISSKIVEHFI